jgi:hypothetical protein
LGRTISADIQTQEETVEIRFLSGQWHTIYIPKSKVDEPGYSPEELYDGYWDGKYPDDVEVIEGDLDHIWEE